MNKPYYAVIFTNRQSEDLEGYGKMAETMESLTKKQLGYLSFESAKNELGIAISYWETIEDIKNWKANLDHLEAKDKNKWYSWYKVRICKVERDYEFGD